MYMYMYNKPVLIAEVWAQIEKRMTKMLKLQLTYQSLVVKDFK